MKNTKSFFTLLELLIVIAIIGILITLLIPSMRKAREATKNAVCLSNFKQMSLATYVYAVEHNRNLPASFNGDSMNPPYWYGAILPYIENDNEWSTRIYQCPTVEYTGENELPRNYGSNTQVFKHHPSPSTPHLNQDFRLQLGQVIRPSEVYAIADLSVWNPDSGDCFPFNRFPFTWTIESWRYNSNPDQVLPSYLEYDNTYTDDSIKIRFRHMGDKVANFSFPDGHARGMRMTQVKAINMFNEYD